MYIVKFIKHLFPLVNWGERDFYDLNIKIDLIFY